MPGCSGPAGTEVVALAAAFVIAALATPAGISGAVLLLPFQVGVLGTPSPAVTPTNLLYNVVATPGAIYRYWRQGQTGGRLTRVLICGTLPGVIGGSLIRVELLPSARVFDLVVAAVLVPVGSWVTMSGPAPGPARARLVRRAPDPRRRPHRAAAAVGCVGGIYGIGGGSILAPVLTGAGRQPPGSARGAGGNVRDVGGRRHHLHDPVAPPARARVADWPTGIALGAGGLAGAYTGARIQSRLPDLAIRRVMGVLVIAIGIRYLWSGLA